MTPSCPYCHHVVAPGKERLCPTCAAPHHAECWEENQGCAVALCESRPTLPFTSPPAARDRLTVALGEPGFEGSAETSAEGGGGRRLRRALVALVVIIVVGAAAATILAGSDGSHRSAPKPSTVQESSP